VPSAPEVPGRRELHAASRAVTVAARHLTVIWILSLTVSVLLVLSAAVMTVMVLTTDNQTRWPATSLGVFLMIAMLYNVTRFVPLEPEPLEPGLVPSPEDAEAIGAWVASCADGWRPAVRLVPQPTVHVDLGELVIGLPMVMCLREQELAALVRDARDVAVPDALPPVARAIRISRGSIGRGLWTRRGRDAWVSRLLVRSVYSRVAALEEARTNWVRTLRARRDERWLSVAAEADTVMEGWEILAQRWLEPALERHRWHAEPFTGLRLFLDTCREEGFIESQLPRSESVDAVKFLPEAASYERPLAELLVRAAPHARQPTPWSEHPTEVTAAEWRKGFAEGLDAARRATGAPQPATVENLLQLIEAGWGDGIAAVLTAPGVMDKDDERPPAADVVRLLLEAAISVALLDSGVVTPTWSWPHGTDLLDREGRLVSVAGVVAEFGDRTGALREWLTDLGVDLTAPLWLAEGVVPLPEQPLFAVEAYRGLRSYHVVATERAVHLFRRGVVRAIRERIRMRMHGTEALLRPTMLAVQKGEFAERETGLDLADVVRATFSPMIGGHWWRLQINTADTRLVLRGDGLGRDTEEAFSALLGDRLSTRWLHSHRWLLYARNGVGFVCFGIGMVGLLCAAFYLFSPGPSVSRSDAGLIGVLSAVVLGLGFVPDLVAEGFQRLRAEVPHTALVAVREGPRV
jgi:hypothetical protein